MKNLKKPKSFFSFLRKISPSFLSSYFLILFQWFNKSFRLKKGLLQNQRGVSLVEIIIFTGIFLVLALGTNQFLTDTLQFQNFTLSQTFELNLRKLLKDLNQEACTKTFSGKNIGEDIAHIRDERGISLISDASMFKKNLKIIKIDTTPKITSCNQIHVLSGQNCPPGCTNPASFPGACSGSESTSIPGYAELHIFFSRPGSLFETKTKDGVCNSSDQTNCYQHSCLVKLIGGPPLREGGDGKPIGACELLDCSEELTTDSNPNFPCYKVSGGGGDPKRVSLIGCGDDPDDPDDPTSPQGIKVDNTVALGYKAGGGGGLTGEENTFVGFEAGKNTTSGEKNTFIGYWAGMQNTTGEDNIFIGFEAGKNTTSGEKNTFIGYWAGMQNSGDNNILIGQMAGKVNQGSHNVFIGETTGQNTSSGSDENVFIGRMAGAVQNRGNKNVFIGNEAGHRNKGNKNVFIGFETGKNFQFGEANTFIGSTAGKKTGSPHPLKNNTFIGYKAGLKSKSLESPTRPDDPCGNTGGPVGIVCDNLFIGYTAGIENTQGKNNTFIGSYAGEENTTGENNIFIGYKAASHSDYQTKSGYLVIGNSNTPTWITAEIGTDDFKVKGTKVSYEGHTHPSTSSRTLKKNIKDFKNFDKSLDDILKLPLFTFEFKKELPQKSRIGFISEELPPHLQIKDKPSRPDIVSIRGTILAAIKALYKKMINLKEEIPSQIKNLKEEFLIGLNESRKVLKEEIFQQLKALSKNLETAREELSLEVKTKEHISLQKWKALIEQEKRQTAPLTEELQKTKKELSQAKADLAYTKAEIENTKKQIKLLGEKLNALK